MANTNEPVQKTLKKCSKCKEEIQIDAKRCKHCEADLRNWFIRHKIITIILIIFVIGIIASAANTGKNASNNFNNLSNIKKEELKEPAIKITARELYAKYEANEIQADELYKNKVLEVSGVIGSIGKDILDDPYVALKTDGIISSIQCMLADSEKAKASQLKKEQLIVMEGKNSGKLGNVILRNCVIK